MNVSEMITTMRNLSIGKVYSDADANAIALTYLNLAHDELYRETANLNSIISVKDTIISIANQSFITLSRNPFLISTVYCTGKLSALLGLSLVKFEAYQRETVYKNMPEVYSNIGKVLNFHPIVSGVSYTFDVRYPPERTALDITTPEESIPYPLSFHGVLVDGALYYLFQDESGFKNTLKENRAEERWLSGKANLINYLYGSNRQIMSTFQSA